MAVSRADVSHRETDRGRVKKCLANLTGIVFNNARSAEESEIEIRREMSGRPEG